MPSFASSKASLSCRTSRAVLRLRNPQLSSISIATRPRKTHHTPPRSRTRCKAPMAGASVSLIYASTDQYSVSSRSIAACRKTSMCWDRSICRALSWRDRAAVGRHPHRTGVGPLTIDHYGSLPAVTLSFNLSPGTALKRCDGCHRHNREGRLPPSVTGRFTGTARAFQDSLRELPLQLLL